MIIDMHTHIFPDKIAAHAVAELAAAGDSPAHTDGTAAGLINSMKEAGVNCSIVLPVVTNPKQFDSIKRFAVTMNESFPSGSQYRLHSFGGIHPESEHYKKELLEIKEAGLRGIKLHPDYQKTYIDDINYLRIIDFAAELGLIISVHAGVDVGLPSPVHCPPERVHKLLEQIQPPGLILAHLGGFACWDEVEQLLVGENVYLDVGYVLGNMPEKQLVRIIKAHGADKIFFATDSPWGSQKEDLAYFRQLPFTVVEFDQMLYKNAQKLGVLPLSDD